MKDSSIKKELTQFRNTINDRSPGPEIISRLARRLREKEGVWFRGYKNYTETKVNAEGNNIRRFYFSFSVINPPFIECLVTMEYFYPRFFIVDIWNESKTEYFDINSRWQRPLEDIEGTYLDIILPRTVESMEDYFKYRETKFRTIPYHWKELEATEIIKEFIRDEKKKISGANI